MLLREVARLRTRPRARARLTASRWLVGAGLLAAIGAWVLGYSLVTGFRPGQDRGDPQVAGTGELGLKVDVAGEQVADLVPPRNGGFTACFVGGAGDPRRMSMTLSTMPGSGQYQDSWIAPGTQITILPYLVLEPATSGLGGGDAVGDEGRGNPAGLKR